MKKILLYAVLIVLVVFGVMLYNYTHQTTGSTQAAGLQPAQLRIPAIQVDAPVMNVGQTAQGLMDAPVSKALNSPYWTHVFWYAPGTLPGQTGNAVIAGHVDRVNGDPAVFWFLRKVVVGDDIYVTTAQGQTLHFVVDHIVSYAIAAPSGPIINTVFGPSTGHHLNLITCNGVWTGHGYDQRLVVFTTQVN